MIDIAPVLKFLFPSADPSSDWIVRDNDKIQTIVFWNEAIGKQPTQDDIIQTASSPEFIAWDLSNHKATKNAAIRAKTQLLMEKKGFAYDNRTFELNRDARTQWNVNYLLSFTNNASYPVFITDIGGSEYSLADSNAVTAFWKTAAQATQGFSDGERALTKQVAAAQTIDEVDAIKDNR